MKKARDIIKKIYIDDQKNCAEALLTAGMDSVCQALPEDCARLIGVFSGGISCGHVCGAILGGAAAIGLAVNKGDEGSFELSKSLTKKFFEECKEKLGSELCSEIKPKWRKDDVRCLAVTEMVAEVLDEALASRSKLS